MSSFLDPSIIKKVAADLKIEPAVVQAVTSVEAPKGPFYSDKAKSPAGKALKGLPVILFEPHVFWRALVRHKYNPSGLLSRADVKKEHGDLSDILYQRWRTGVYGSTEKQWDRFDRAAALCRPAAVEACSWGAFQILGENWISLGYSSAEEFADSMMNVEGQVEAFVRFLRVNKLVHMLADKEWAAFASRYNGKDYAKNGYDTALAKAYREAK